MTLYTVDIAVQGLKNNISIIHLSGLILFLISYLTSADNFQNWDDSIEKTKRETFKVETFIAGFDIPWGMAFLPNKDLIVSD